MTVLRGRGGDVEGVGRGRGGGGGRGEEGMSRGQRGCRERAD